MTTTSKGPRCPRCDSGQVHILVNGTVVCRRCGARTEPEEVTK